MQMMHPEHDESRVKYWRDGDDWRCAAPWPDPFAEIPGRKRPCWKHYGLRGRGKTKAAALEDWRAWVRASQLVAEIY